MCFVIIFFNIQNQTKKLIVVIILRKRFDVRLFSNKPAGGSKLLPGRILTMLQWARPSNLLAGNDDDDDDDDGDMRMITIFVAHDNWKSEQTMQTFSGCFEAALKNPCCMIVEDFSSFKNSSWYLFLICWNLTHLCLITLNLHIYLSYLLLFNLLKFLLTLSYDIFFFRSDKI